MDAPRFTKNDAGFTCRVCGKEVLPLGYTSRNHCPFCLSSLHVDINPGAKELIFCPHEPVTGSHVGPGMLGLFFFGEGR